MEFRSTYYMLHVTSQRGVAALATIIAISLFLISVSFLIATRGGTAILGGQLEAQAAKAQFLAEAGIQDALMKLVRGETDSISYNIRDTEWITDIGITQNPPSQAIITATSTVIQGSISVRRIVRATVTMNEDGKIIQITKTNL